MRLVAIVSSACVLGLAAPRVVIGQTTPLRAMSPVSGAVMSGRILADSTDTPIVGAEVTIPDLSLVTRTDSLGRYALSGLKTGAHRLVVRSIGYEPYSTTLTLRSAEDFEADIALTSSGTRLKDFEVRATISDRRLHEFYENKRFGFGYFVGPEIFQKYAHRKMSDLLLGYMPGANFGGKSGGVPRRRACPMKVYHNGVHARDGAGNDFDLNRIQTQDVLGVEYYTPATVPARYAGLGSSCGVLILWTN
jgi:hypothetical protein